MHLQQRLTTCGMASTYESIAAQMSRLEALGVPCTPEDLLSPSCSSLLQRKEAEMRAVSRSGVRDEKELNEFNRLVVLLARETGESFNWLSRQSLERLRLMMDQLEA